ncbi:MAG TPA: hypothetical protein VKA08_16000 [Balneolales bacterium]|nr:hypothetical protein [Balneolales bacterium]
MSSDPEEITTYALWLIPGDPEFRELEKLIYDNQQLVQEPAFIPHITLLSGIEPEPDLSYRFQSLRRLTPGFTLRCRESGRGSDYFHCLYIPVIISAKLKWLRKRAENIFTFSSTRTFQPHISLMYSDPRSTLVSNGISLLTDFTAREVNVVRLELWNTNGSVDNWKCIYREKL